MIWIRQRTQLAASTASSKVIWPNAFQITRNDDCRCPRRYYILDRPSHNMADRLDAAGEVNEKVYDVAWSGDRKPGADGKLPPVGNTVDVPSTTWTNTIGAPELVAVWKDPDFDHSQRAFYYGRVIEI